MTIKRNTLALLFSLLMLTPTLTYARGGRGHTTGHRATTHVAHVSTHHATTHSTHHIKRSAKARYDFMVQTGYPHGRKGYIVDHIKPLCKGGADAPFNMQWQSVADAKAKDRWECK